MAPVATVADKRADLAGPGIGDYDRLERILPSDYRSALASWAWNAELNFGETYSSGAVELRGDLFLLLEAIYRALGNRRRRWWRQAPNDARAARHNVHHHYDLGNAFYRLWLDRETASCIHPG